MITPRSLRQLPRMGARSGRQDRGAARAKLARVLDVREHARISARKERLKREVGRGAREQARIPPHRAQETFQVRKQPNPDLLQALEHTLETLSRA